MEIRQIDERDIKELSLFLKELYKESAVAMRFDKEPSDAELEALFWKKIEGIRDGKVVDIVAVDGRIIGECELVIVNGTAMVGILIVGNKRRKGIGSMLLDQGTALTKRLGAAELVAEVGKGNKAAVDFFLSKGFSYMDAPEKDNTVFLAKSIA